MFKHDTMARYVADRHPNLAPRAPRRPTTGLALSTAIVGRRTGAVVASLPRLPRPTPVVVDLPSIA